MNTAANVAVIIAGRLAPSRGQSWPVCDYQRLLVEYRFAFDEAPGDVAIAVDPATAAAANSLSQALAQLRRTLLQERVALQLVEQAAEAQKAADAANITVGRGRVLDIEA